MFQYSFNKTLIDIKGVTISYGSQVILNNINLQIRDIVRPNTTQGQIIAVLGPSGIGKTQLFKCIAGLQTPTQGEVIVNDTIVKQGDVGVVFQNYPLFRHLTINDNLLISCKDQTIVDQLLARFKLNHLKDKYSEQLSGGQRQRISILQQVLRNNHFLLMDEPFSGLDIISKQNMTELIRSISTLHEHNTIIFTTHDIECAVELAEQIIIIGPVENQQGASIIHNINLIDSGIAWREQNTSLVEYHNMISHIRNIFFAFN